MKFLGKCISQQFWDISSSKFIFIPTRAISKPEMFSVFFFFKQFKRINTIIGTPDRIFIYDYFGHSLVSVYPTSNAKKVFPNNLLNLKRYNFKIQGTSQKPRLHWINAKFQGVDVYFIKTIAKKVNATFSSQFYDMKNWKQNKLFMSFLMDGSADLSLNTMNSLSLTNQYMKNSSSVSTYLKTFTTFDEEGFCALVPIPPRVSFFKYLLKPFDIATWILMAVSVISLAVLWMIFKKTRDGRNLNSPGYMVFRIIAMFLGQDIPSRQTRWFHTMIIQLFIFVMMILNNLYQSQLISLMTASRNATRIETVNEMMEQNFIFCSDQFFYAFLYLNDQNSSRYQICPEMYENNNIDYKSMAQNGTVLITRCDNARDMFYTKNNNFSFGHPAEVYYILPEKVFTFYDNLKTGRFTPFLEMFEKFSLIIFESGVRQHWKMLLHKYSDELDLKQIAIDNEDFLLKMNDLKFVFVICGIGLIIATMVFLVELSLKRMRPVVTSTTVNKDKLFTKTSWQERETRKMTEEELNQIPLQPFLH